MSPQLTEAWGAAYIHILVIMLVFALSIPPIIFQFAMPEHIRRIILRREGLRWWYILTVAIMLSALCFIWLLHPCSIGSLTLSKSYIAGVIITVILISICLFCWYKLGIPAIYAKERIVDDVREDLAKSFRETGILEESQLSDLVSLGEQGDSGHEKELVIEAFGCLAKDVLASDKYNGVGLEEYIRGFETILTGREKQGSDRNFCSACDILKCIRNQLDERGFSISHDANFTLKTLGKLGNVAVEEKSESTALTFLEAVASDKYILFHIGLSALRAQKFHIATAALNKLEALAEQTPPLTPDKTVHLFGLLSHFWTTGNSARKRAKNFLFRMQGFFSPSLGECLKMAIEYYYNITSYDTADALTVMLEDVRKGNLTLM